MSFLDSVFSRELLKLTHAEVRAKFPDVKVTEAWVYRFDGDHWEFHFREYYWHGSADNAYDARAKGWSAYLEKDAPEVTT